ncbi:chromosome partition protein MukE [Chryseobacterium sp. EO14]|uniref:chromosome partition protein MukE n=1 Tax=Chryseobacterium sp. EO14 TaxID=2950551 RepID=UPI00210B8D46|nr:chromosome partition protein MukE [Chryseobacterium sp. EO14]MCQ4141887.1 chromosome partition protein MukE [Chryseobacterium sp. EO14]
MADDNSEKVAKYGFLYEKKALSVFSKLDYTLRSGIHIQREYPLDANLFRFLNENENFESLKNYYKDFFNLNLRKDGNEFNQYYYLDINEDGKSNVPSDSRDYLKNEFIIVGMLFLKMYKLDGNIELDSISEFISLLYEEYEEEKNALRKLINDNSSDKGSDLNDERFEDLIKKSFVKFGELGWLLWEDNSEKNKFKIMPSFERLRAAYQPQIETIDNLIKEVKDAK